MPDYNNSVLKLLKAFGSFNKVSKLLLQMGIRCNPRQLSAFARANDLPPHIYNALELFREVNEGNTLNGEEVAYLEFYMEKKPTKAHQDVKLVFIGQFELPRNIKVIAKKRPRLKE